jgi:hypothetical protein
LGAVAEKRVAELPVDTAARLLSPEADPTSMTYEVATQLPLGASHVSVTPLLLTDAARFAGAPIPAHPPPPPPPTVTPISFDGAVKPPVDRSDASLILRIAFQSP